MKNIELKMAAVIVGLGMFAATASTQTVVNASGGSSCRASIGITGIRCSNCTITSNEGERRYDFRTEPTIEAVSPGSPADGLLRNGDVIIAVDGRLITTRDGGNRFGRLEVGETITLRIRRGDWEREVRVTPQELCTGDSPPAPTADSPAPPRSDVSVGGGGFVEGRAVRNRPPRPSGAIVADAPSPGAPVAYVAPALPALPPSGGGRLGFSIECDRCGLSTETNNLGGRATTTRRWSFSSPPRINRIESDGPAARAGLRNNDRITHLNGIPITEPEAGRILANLDGGQEVSIGYERGGQRGEVQVTARETVRVPVAEVAGVSDVSDATSRYSGMVGEAFVTVEGAPVNVSRSSDGSSHMLVIRSGDIVVRVTVPQRGDI